ncbi:MAG: hypothetical protein QOJ16_1334, partial [Acidobacteriota bacterium]|nr:hypothetical protein [Acidobacteriota bacterium]
NPQHLYGRHLGACPWCARAAAARVAGTVLPGAAASGGIGSMGAGPLPGVPGTGFRPAPKVASGPVPVSAGSKNLSFGCMGVGVALLLAFFGYVFLFAKKDVVPDSGEKPIDPEAVAAMAQLQKRQTNPAIPGGCDPLALSWVRTLIRIAPVRGGQAALLPLLDKEVSYRTWNAHEPLDPSCMDLYLQALAAQVPGNWKYSPFATGGMESLTALLDNFNSGGSSDDNSGMGDLLRFAKPYPSYCPPSVYCEVQIVPDSVQTESATRIGLNAHLRERKDFGDWRDRGFRLRLEWDSRSRKWSAAEDARTGDRSP